MLHLTAPFISSVDALPNCTRVVGIGIFDGVHLGHQALLKTICTLADSHAMQSSVLTFHPHPSHITRPTRPVQLLEPLSVRQQRFLKHGIKEVFIEPFNEDFSRISAEDFILEILVARLKAKHIVVGSQFSFGYRQQGNIEKLHQMGGHLGFRTHAIELVSQETSAVSSSSIRSHIQNGHVEKAAHMLGRDFTLWGNVVRGDGRGKTFSIPTANICAENEVLPHKGVYAGYVQLLPEQTYHRAVINVGTNPTFNAESDQHPLRIEAHIIGSLLPDFYNKRISVSFHKRLRDEMMFSSVDALLQHIRQDIKNAHTILG